MGMLQHFLWGGGVFSGQGVCNNITTTT